MLSEIGRYARRVWLAERQRAGAGFHQEAVGVAVIATFEFDDFVAMGEAARQANGAHGGFGAGVNHAHHVHAGHQLAHQLGHFHFHLGWRAEAQTARSRFNHRVTDVGVVMTQHHRAPRTDIIDIAFAVGVIQIRTVSAFDEQRHTAHTGKCTYRGVHTAGDQALRCGIQVF